MVLDEHVIAAALSATLDHYNISVGRGLEAPIKCPSHDDAHASASANLSRGVWFCHACGAGGSALHVIMAQESCDLSAARERLAAIVEGIEFEAPAQRRVTTRRKGKSKWTPPRLRR